MVELENDYNEVLSLPIEERATSKRARELRLKYAKIRTSVKEIHKTQKAFYLAGGRFVDGWKNAQEFASLGKEEKLEEIEKYAENLEKQRIADLQAERTAALEPYEVENLENLNLGTMPDNIWENFLSGSIATYNNKKEAERLAKEAEEKRLAEEAAAERERVRVENEKLKKELEEKEAALQAERQAAIDAENAKKAVRTAREAELRPIMQFVSDLTAVLDAEEADYQAELLKAKELALKHKEAELEKQRIEQEKRDKELEEQRKANIEAARLRKELEDKKKAEEEAELQRQAELEAELSKGDGDKMKSLIADLEALKEKYSFKSKKNKAIHASVNELLDKIVVYINQKS